MNTRFLRLLSAACLAVGLTTTAWSQSTLYFDRGDFVSAAQAIPGMQQSISFGFPFVEGPSVTIGDVTFTGRDLIRGGPLGSEVALYNFDSGFPMGIHFANGTRAFGADYSSWLSPYYSSFTATLSLDNGEVLTFTASTVPNSTFVGFISPTPIKNLTFSDGGLFPSPNIGHQELIGNLYVVMEVPEPSVLSLFAFSALLLGWRLSRRGKRMG